MCKKVRLKDYNPQNPKSGCFTLHPISRVGPVQSIQKR